MNMTLYEVRVIISQTSQEAVQEVEVVVSLETETEHQAEVLGNEWPHPHS